MTFNWRLAVVCAFLILSVVVDFASKILSVAADAVIVGAALYFAWPLLMPSKKE